MYGVDILVKEHENIKRMAKVMRAASLQVFNGEELVTKDFYQMLDFVRNYADKHHHKKEEDILFEYMKKELGKLAQNLITNGMLVEHDLGRLHMRELEAALQEYEANNSVDAKLDIVVNATAYTYLINRHIDKENEVVFTFGAKNLTEESRTIVDQRTKEMEEGATKEGVQDKYLKVLEELEKKYILG
ncbi:hemerythrin domain-containing protein [Lachnoclostridium phytofermentans]|uniref:Hemerythrin HHE cation binding domain protein n=1 Tax=Lachnoclostridium phytofermentans (strain ATCC 700394 / DSM 18823 / ISDg) TaxID=357809 RepID=A9KPY4_LACP7|nr:hemerythrin domain-containing protein [Lachnoclostridium phytofermentans]ABX41883.1 Hemerythrin HHE cation binding domain protein [Lachnoclostridium phytofermentans ISDg]